MKTTRLFIIVLSVMAVMAGLGCASLSNYVTPAEIDNRAVLYATDMNTAEPNEYDGYGNLHKAEKLTKAVLNGHQRQQLDLVQLMEKDKQTYAQLNDVVQTNLAIAVQRERQLFGPQGLLSMTLGMAGFGGLTGLIGLMRKRPKDITPEELKQAVAGKDAALTEKEKQFAELVKGVKKYLDPTIYSHMKEAQEILETELSKATSTETKKAIAQSKVML